MNAPSIPRTGNEFIDSLMIEVSNISQSHRPIYRIQQQAYEYFIEQNIYSDWAHYAAEAVAKARRSSLDIVNLQAVTNILASQ